MNHSKLLLHRCNHKIVGSGKQNQLCLREDLGKIYQLSEINFSRRKIGTGFV